MILYKFIGLAVEAFILVYAIVNLVLIIRNKRYQRVWKLKKTTLMRVDPAITKAKLCEHYVMFCNKNKCKVKF